VSEYSVCLTGFWSLGQVVVVMAALPRVQLIGMNGIQFTS
jgi:hypothetical protein